jgi:predicted transcriptional regulator
MSERALLLSIRPQFATKIFNGSKTVELRRVRPSVSAGDLVLVYASSPTRALLGAFEVDRVLCSTPSTIWSEIEDCAGVSRTEFDEYYAGAKKAFGIFIKRTWLFDEPVKLPALRQKRAQFRPPQGYHYVSTTDVLLSGLKCGKLQSALCRSIQAPSRRAG